MRPAKKPADDPSQTSPPHHLPQLDLVSDPDLPLRPTVDAPWPPHATPPQSSTPSTAQASPAQASPAQASPAQASPFRTDRRARTFRFHFSCCQVAAQWAMPQAVLEGRSSVWRVHCPRCGRLSEIPIVD